MAIFGTKSHGGKIVHTADSAAIGVGIQTKLQHGVTHLDALLVIVLAAGSCSSQLVRLEWRRAWTFSANS